MTGNGWFRRILVPFAITRAGLALVGILALSLVGSVRDRMPGNLVAHSPASLPLEIWARWDAEWYLFIAEHGYQAGNSLNSSPLGYHPEDTAGFFPLYPLLIRTFSATGLPPVAAGVLVSNLSLLAALTLLSRLVARERDEETAAIACWALLAFPASLFLSAVYSESLALALTLAAFLSAREGRWGFLALAGFLGALARPTGLMAGAALLADVRRRRGGWRGYLALLAFPAGTAAFSYYCHRAFGDPLAWVHRQSRWRGAWAGPWRAFQRFFEHPPRLHGAHDSILELLFAVLFVLTLVPILRRYRASWGTFALLTVLVPLGSTLWSFTRLALIDFPFFVLMGEAGSRHREVLPVYLALALPLGGLLMALFACGWWAG